jgi:hypothetical protein
MNEYYFLITTTLKELKILEIYLIISILFFIGLTIFFYQLSKFSNNNTLIVRNLFINFSDRCSQIIDEVQREINTSLNYYKDDKEFINLSENLNQEADSAKKELKKEIDFFQSRLREKGLEELNVQDIINERISNN